MAHSRSFGLIIKPISFTIYRIKIRKRKWKLCHLKKINRIHSTLTLEVFLSLRCRYLPGEFWRGLPVRDIQGTLSLLVFKLWLCSAFTTALPMSLCSVTCKVALTIIEINLKRLTFEFRSAVGNGIILCLAALVFTFKLCHRVWSVGIMHLLVQYHWFSFMQPATFFFFKERHIKALKRRKTTTAFWQCWTFFFISLLQIWQVYSKFRIFFTVNTFTRVRLSETTNSPVCQNIHMGVEEETVLYWLQHGHTSTTNRQGGGGWGVGSGGVIS